VTSTEIANLALSHLGIGKDISDLDAERSQEARAIRRVWHVALKEVLRDYDWPFASKTLTLAEIEEDPTEEWAYAYVYPSDCVKFRRILSGNRNETQDSRIPYRVVQHDGATALYTDMELAQGEYTVLVDQTGYYPPDFVMAFSFKLAFLVAAQLTAGDPFKLRVQALQMYQMSISKAVANGANEDENERIPESEFIRARE
jgi:hypothetical protein